MQGRGFLLFWTILLALACLAGAAAPLSAQGVSTPAQSSLIQTPSLGSAANTNALQDNDTFVSFIDSALPKSQVRLMFDDASRDRRPTRAEFFQPKGGLPGSPGPPLPETNVNYQQLMTHGEVVIIPSLSTFMETPLLFVEPDVNKFAWGLGDINLGMKWAFISTSQLLATFQLRAYIPTASNSALGTDHVSVEPALLLNYGLLSCLTLEGEGRLWVPIDGTDFAGNVVRYGIGLSYGQRSPSDIWIAPVLEAVGWTVLGGKALVPGPTFTVQDAAGTTIFNAYGGVRVGFGNSASVYAGYGRAFTGPAWYKDVFRIEFRFFF